MTNDNPLETIVPPYIAHAQRCAQNEGTKMSTEHSLAPAENAVTDRIIGEPECREITDLSRTSRWRLMRAGKFPKKITLSPNRTGWRLSQVVEWLAEREAV